jgi:diguanylate cyclase (GGDEF)-like protein
VLLLDLDRFKRINDTFGHLAGDAVLKEVAATLAEQLEPGMVLGRYGGEEFAILLPNCAELAQAKRVAERLRVAVEARLVKSPTSDELLEVTVSIGLTLAQRGEGWRICSTGRTSASTWPRWRAQLRGGRGWKPAGDAWRIDGCRLRAAS